MQFFGLFRGVVAKKMKSSKKFHISRLSNLQNERLKHKTSMQINFFSCKSPNSISKNPLLLLNHAITLRKKKTGKSQNPFLQNLSNPILIGTRQRVPALTASLGVPSSRNGRPGKLKSQISKNPVPGGAQVVATMKGIFAGDIPARRTGLLKTGRGTFPIICPARTGLAADRKGPIGACAASRAEHRGATG